MTKNEKLQENAKHRCQIFHCDHRGDRYCCHYCDYRKKCKNPCLNQPERCGQAFEQEEKKNGK